MLIQSLSSEKLFLFALHLLLTACLSSARSPLFLLHALNLISLFLRGAAIRAHNLVIWSDGSVSFLFGKGGSVVLANCSLCGAEATVSYSAGPVCSSISAEVCTILHASFSLVSAAPTILPITFCSSQTLVLSLVHILLYSSISHSLAYLAVTIVFLQLLYYQVTMGCRSLMPGFPQSWKILETKLSWKVMENLIKIESHEILMRAEKLSVISVAVN